MHVTRKFVAEGTDPFSLFEYDTYDCLMKHHATGEVTLDLKGCAVPRHWSVNARNTLISKYFRKAGTPLATVPCEAKGEFDGIPQWLLPHRPMAGCAYGPETSVVSVIRRIVGHWTFEGLYNGYFDPSHEDVAAASREDCEPDLYYRLAVKNARAYFDEMVYLMLAQGGAPNSPQWFNTGLWWAYGITGEPQGHWRVTLGAEGTDAHEALTADTAAEARRHLETFGFVAQSESAYRHVQAHACYILSVEDSMMGDNGILSWYEREARIFKYGSGSGANLSKLRAKKEPLSIGGSSSGMMSWMETADRSAGAVKSGGTTRRAAKMVSLDLDHPDILDFINCKVESENVVAAMVAGSEAITAHCQRIMDARRRADAAGYEITCGEARADRVPENYIRKAAALADQGVEEWPAYKFTADFDSRAYAIAPFQNANNSVRTPTGFYRAVDGNGNWRLTNRTDPAKFREVKARDLERAVATATWMCGDPGVQYDTIINDWNVTPKDGRINGSNPCSEHMRLDGSACNLASERLTLFLGPAGFDVEAFRHATELWVITLDITNTMAHLPDKETAMNVYLYRDIGLGFADLGALLLGYGLPYDSDEARAVAGAMTALMQGQAHLTSAKLALQMGAYPRFAANRDDHLRCVRNHIAACNLDARHEFEGLTVPAEKIMWDKFAKGWGDGWDAFASTLEAVWKEAYRLGEKTGYRNAEMTVIAPTGTIGITLDCETTGVEPLVALMVFKQLVGGGSMKFTPSASISKALLRLGYTQDQADAVVEAVKATHGSLPCHLVKPEHWPVFQTAIGEDAIRWEAHILMMAAVQSFVSGAISKTVNMPETATIEDIRRAYRLGHDTGCKAIAIYRDESKLSQPLTTRKKEPEKGKPTAPVLDAALKAVTSTPEAAQKFAEAVSPLIKKAMPLVSPPALNVRVRLGWHRIPGVDLAVPFGPGTLYLRTTRYDDGKCAEIWATFSGVSDMVQSLVGQLCRTANIALQYGVPLDAIVNSWVDSNFYPNGFVGGHPYIKNARSVVNLIARLLDYHELGNTDRLTIRPAAGLSEADTAAVEQEIASDTDAYADAKVSGEACPECGSQQYVQSGSSCKKCLECGYSGACG